MLRYHSQLGYRFDVKLTPIAKPLHFIDRELIPCHRF
jgi:hypothetical protein